MKRQLLVAIDSSVTSSLSLEYLANLFAQDEEIDFHLAHCVLNSQGILPEPEDARNSLLPDKPRGKQEQISQLALEKAKLKLHSFGVPEERIKLRTLHGSNVATTIAMTAEKELVDAVVVARRGMGIVGELLLGSVSSSLFKQCRQTPLWIIDGAVRSEKILVPVDGTPPSLMAIDHLAHIFSNRDDVIFHLFHARGFLSPPPVCRPEDFYDRWGKTWCDTHLSGSGCMFTGPTELLTGAGIPKECVIPLPEPTALEESSAIISSAKRSGCSTIVIGRRPDSVNKGLLGGVSSRAILQTEDMALWVVG